LKWLAPPRKKQNPSRITKIAASVLRNLRKGKRGMDGGECSSDRSLISIPGEISAFGGRGPSYGTAGAEGGEVKIS